ncbi:tripartite tricarboxylate transporter TctB family protein [Alicyclobacillus kakegawensis]|uniref:tripartite tricarboxylate transporter TctB family protein n=1 Tax=Alicyclobacillus kakegawensis TaxID=392012 RepID=UPI000830A508|nr:tripartite tricarboxylate transporter TctB family protein [Alicyclobacillus kakegawensis]
MKFTTSIDTIIVDLTLLAVFIVFAAVGGTYQPMARELPLPIAIAGCILVFVLFLSDLFPRLRQVLGFVHRQGTGSSLSVSTAAPARETPGLPAREWLRLLRWICWLTAFAIGIQIIGYLAASGVFVFLVTWLEGRMHRWQALLSAIGTCAFFYIVFHLFLSVTFT